jgi:hypothetical protein
MPDGSAFERLTIALSLRIQAAHRVGYGGWGGAGSFLRRERAGGEETLRVDNL